MVTNRVLIISIILLQGCSAALVPYTSDPKKKLSYAHYLMDVNRWIPAHRLGKEVLSEFTELGDKQWMAEAHFFLASLYKQYSNAANPQFFVRNPEFDPKNGRVVFHINEAIRLFRETNNLTQMAKAEFVLANFYMMQGQSEFGCRQYRKSLESYRMGISANPKNVFEIKNPNAKNFPELVSLFISDHCH